jgi:acetyltransferase-like isoleucine patch superfamily enzyme
MKYPYKDIIEKVTSNDPLSIYNRKYKFFESLQEAVYDGLTPDEFRKNNTLTVLEDNIPYWEIHHYPKFTTSSMLASEHELWFSESDQERHLYFTFKKFISDSEHRDLLKAGHYLDQDKNLYYYEVGFGKQKINKHYKSGDPFKDAANLNEKIRIYILEDKDDNAETLQKLSPEIYKELIADEGANIIPSTLPQMLFVAGKGAYRPVTPNTNTIVCIDTYTNVGIAAGEDSRTVTLSGNIFINQAVLLFPLANNKITIGKNVVIMRSSYVLSSLVGDNVLVGEYARAEEDTKLGNGCFVNSNSTITRYQEILPAQQVSAKLPWIYDIFSTDGKFLYERFLDLVKAGKESYLEKLEKSQ